MFPYCSSTEHGGRIPSARPKAESVGVGGSKHGYESSMLHSVVTWRPPWAQKHAAEGIGIAKPEKPRFSAHSVALSMHTGWIRVIELSEASRLARPLTDEFWLAEAYRCIAVTSQLEAWQLKLTCN